jgi:hypothetical protein
MRLTLRYGKLIDPHDSHQRGLRPARVVDDVLGLRAEQVYLGYLGFRYLWTPKLVRVQQRVGGPEVEPPTLPQLLADLRGWMGADRPPPPKTEQILDSIAPFVLPGQERFPGRLTELQADFDELRGRFARAVGEAAQGILSPEIALDLARVRRVDDGVIEGDDLPALAAWCLEELLRRGPVDVADCDLCGLPWLRERGVRFCMRPAPGHGASCRSVAAQTRFRSVNRQYHRERKRLYERVRRGTLPREEYERWLRENRPGVEGRDWKRFEHESSLPTTAEVGSK